MKFIIKSIFASAFLLLVFLFLPSSVNAVSISISPSSPLPEGTTSIDITISGLKTTGCTKQGYQITSVFNSSWDGDAVESDGNDAGIVYGTCSVNDVNVGYVSKNQILAANNAGTIILRKICDDMKTHSNVCKDEFKEGGDYGIQVWEIRISGTNKATERTLILDRYDITGPLPSSKDCSISWSNAGGEPGTKVINIQKPSNMTLFNVYLNQFIASEPLDNTTPLKALGYTLDTGGSDIIIFKLPEGLNTTGTYKIIVESAQNGGKRCYPESGLIFTLDGAYYDSDVAEDPPNSGDTHDNTDPSELPDEPGDVIFKDPNETQIITPFGTITLTKDNPGAEIAQAILNVGIGVAGGIAFLMMIFGAYRLIFAAGNPDSIQQGREIITAAIAGLLVVIFAVAIMNFLGFTLFGLSI